jgi:catechol 2,3-dioxygenase-like lactoylglutathione lyase family enzyme
MSPMSIRRVVPNIKAKAFEESRDFYVDLLGFKVAMDTGAIVTLMSPGNPTAQISLLRDEGIEDGVLPYAHLSIEVANVDEVHERALA